MRVLIVPELYRPDDATANGTLNDAVVWVEEWLDIDPNIHVYWLLAPPEVANYDPEYVLADRDRVTLVAAEPFMHGRDHQGAFTESGYSETQFEALRDAIYDRLGYVDVVIDQLRRGRADLYKWLLALDGHRVEHPEPFDVVVNVHDLQLPFKYANTGWRNRFQRETEISDAVLADGMWFKADIDVEGMAEFGTEFMRESVVEWALDAAIRTGSPIDFSAFDEEYADEPRWLHIAGSIWDKKQVGTVMGIAERLYDRFGIRTVMTSMSTIPAEYAEKPWIETHSKASRKEFEAALRKGDICVSATEYETLARTWFEQAGSGQVLVARDQPWIYDAIPRDYRLAGDIDELPDLAVWAVEHWDEAVAESKRMLEHAKEIRDPERSGQRTYDDMARRVEEKVETDDPTADDNDELVGRALAEFDGEVSLDELNEATAEFTPHGDPILSGKCALSELVFALRRRGYADTGNPGTPVFESEND
ncbi:polysaccharide deacetylase family protein [Halorussus amylolyticus]|uniref:glycosyltransferase family 1 protein n=1 Tax=Halorussus amylolyticus TaxID=1126242 RepID=UPI00104C7C56|nr:glycosyltransferase family 1 protein [Halorussus amylolyticus]